MTNEAAARAYSNRETFDAIAMEYIRLAFLAGAQHAEKEAHNRGYRAGY